MHNLTRPTFSYPQARKFSVAPHNLKGIMVSIKRLKAEATMDQTSYKSIIEAHRLARQIRSEEIARLFRALWARMTRRDHESEPTSDTVDA